jgi:hypothetical protein
MQNYKFAYGSGCETWSLTLWKEHRDLPIGRVTSTNDASHLLPSYRIVDTLTPIASDPWCQVIAARTSDHCLIDV